MGFASEHMGESGREKLMIGGGVVAALVCVIALVVILAPDSSHAGRIGSHVIEQGDLSDEEARAMLDEMAEASRITITVNPEVYRDTDGRLLVDFEVPEDNNGLSERIEIEQGGAILYASRILAPGEGIEWTEEPVQDASYGMALLRVHAVDEHGNDTGNPVSFDIVITRQEG